MLAYAYLQNSPKELNDENLREELEDLISRKPVEFIGMRPQLGNDNYNVSAYCTVCEAITSFDPRQQAIVVNEHHTFNGRSLQRTIYYLSQCARCGRGGMAIIGDNGNPQGAVLEEFFPITTALAALPEDVPPEIEAEFREAEQCAAFGANRAASALFRSVLEKTLKANGYVKTNDPTLRDLQKRIDAAAVDGVITDARRKRAHDDIRSLGNDVLHDDWREITDEEVEGSHRYTQRILEDL